MSYWIKETIHQAARERKVLRIVYIEKDGSNEGWRYVEPYSFSNDEGEDALFAWDRGKSGIRRFVLSRIQQIEVTDESYYSRYSIEIF